MNTKKIAVQQWHPKQNDLDAISDHCEEAYEQRRKTGHIEGWTLVYPPPPPIIDEEK